MSPPAEFELSSRPILVGADGSRHSEHAVGWAAELAESAGVDLVVVHALALLETLPGGERVPSDIVSDEVAVRLETEWSMPARNRDLRVRTVLEDGPPLLVLPRVAEREGASMIVIATRGRGQAPVDMIGSTCHGLIETSTIPIVAIR